MRRAADVLLDEQQSTVLGLGREHRDVVLAEDARAHEPEQVAELLAGDPAVREGHRGACQAAALGDDLVEQLVLHARDQRPEGPDVGADPAGPVDDGRPLDDARQRRPERLARGVGRPGPSPRGRRRRRRAAPAAEAPGRLLGAPDRDALDGAPVDEAAPCRTLRPAPEHGRRGTDRGAEQEACLPAPVRAPATSGPGPAGAASIAAGLAGLAGLAVPRLRLAAGFRRIAHAAAFASSTPATSGNASPNIRSAIARKASTSPVVSWTWRRPARRRLERR